MIIEVEVRRVLRVVGRRQGGVWTAELEEEVERVQEGGARSTVHHQGRGLDEVSL